MDDIHQFYNLLKDEECSYKRCGWGREDSQYIRFRVLSRLLDPASKFSLLDVGCGDGEYYRFLDPRFSRMHYEGIDVVGGMIETALKLSPNGIFRCANAMEMPKGAQYDYVMASGTFNIRYQGSKDLTYKMLKKMFDLCKKGIAVNFLNECDVDDKRMQRFSSTNMLAWTMTNISPWVILDRSYLESDFTLFIFKRPFGSQEGDFGNRCLHSG